MSGVNIPIMDEKNDIKELWQNHRRMRADDTRSALIAYYLPMMVDIAKGIKDAGNNKQEIDMDTLMSAAIWTLWDLIEDNLAGEDVPPLSAVKREIQRAMLTIHGTV